VDVHQKLDEIVAAVENAKSMPMSASCVINRSDLLGRLDEVRNALPGSLAQAQELLGGREQVVAQAQQDAQRIVEAAHAERGSLIDGTVIVQQAQAEAGRILAEARREAAEIKVEADDYVDSKLANFEVVLGKTIGSVDRGRAKLLGHDGDPEDLLERADAYVEAQFGAIEAVLRKTLEAVGRGRQKLTGFRPSDELGEHYPEQDDSRADQAAENYGQEPTGQYYPQQQGRPAPADMVPADGYGYQDYAEPAQQPQQQPQHQYQGYVPQPQSYHDPYGYEQTPQQPQQPQQAHDGRQEYQDPGALDETSLFDTGMIDTEQLRRYEQGR
jgi:cell division septum initiation protein DivIVA